MQDYQTTQLRTPGERRNNDETQATSDGNDPLYGKTLFLVAASLGVLAIYIIAVLLLHFLLGESRHRSPIRAIPITPRSVSVSPHLSDCKALDGVNTSPTATSLSMPTNDRDPVTVEMVRSNDKVTNRGFPVQQGSQVRDD
jgi:hypothetical protein